MNSRRARALSKRSKGTKAWETTQHKHCLSCVRVAAPGVPSPYKVCKGGPYKLKGPLVQHSLNSSCAILPSSVA